MESIYFKTENGYILKSEVQGFEYRYLTKDFDGKDQYAIYIINKNSVSLYYKIDVSEQEAIDTIEELKNELNAYLKHNLSER